MRPDLGLEARVRIEAERGGRPALAADLVAPPGITVLFGPSGAGKSTLLAAIAGLVRPHAGRVAIGGEPLFDGDAGIDLPPHRRRVALVFQGLALFPHLDAAANVAYGLPRALPRAERRQLATAWLARTRVAHLAGRRPATFSGGEAQRVALARALAAGPRALLLDEPFSALDEELRTELGTEVRALVAELGIPAVLVTHDRRDALALGDRAIAMREGRTVAEGPVAAVLGEGRSAAPTLREVS